MPSICSDTQEGFISEDRWHLSGFNAFGGVSDIPEENDKPVELHNHSDEWVTEQDNEDSTEEGCASFCFMPLEKEPKRPLKADYKC